MRSLGVAGIVIVVLASCATSPASALTRAEVGTGKASFASGAPVNLAKGVIVGLSSTMARANVASLREATGISSESGLHMRLAGDAQVVVSFPGPQPVENALALAAQLTSRPDVLWAEPDLVLRIADAPSLPDDARFDDQWALWDPPTSVDHGLQAPLGWAATKGDPDVVVAVLDTGWTEHPDLEGQIVNGYDFISDPASANDGDGRDGDSHDPGDWITPSESDGPFSGCDPTNSSWHGTHVAGTIVARQDNRIGISGVAPLSRVLAVRVIGKCGATTSDITDAMVWAAGGHVPGVPDNTHPAQVISMSLGGVGQCGNAFRNAVSFVKSRGVSVVVAAGNEGHPISTSSPANCSGVIPVVATNSDGKRPSWSNFGTRALPAVISAPGVDILSTYNDGLRSPGSPSYEVASGTSMATPHVAGVIALLRSLGVAPRDIESRLQKLVRAFPRSGSGQSCDRTTCGAGLLNLATLSGDGPGPGPAPEPPSDPTLRPAMVGPVNVTYSPSGPLATATVRWAYTPPTGEPKAARFRYRLRVGSSAWTAWRETTSTTLRVSDVPRARLSLAEIAAVNVIGIGPTYQVTLFPN